MAGPDNTTRSLTFQELTELRRRTEVVSKFLQDQLAGPPGDAPADPLARAGVRQVPRPARWIPRSPSASSRRSSRTTGRSRPGPSTCPRSSTRTGSRWSGNRIALYPWEYAHEAKTDRETKTITMASPVRWVVSFTSTYTLSQLRPGPRRQGRAPRRARPSVRGQRAGHPAGDRPRRRAWRRCSPICATSSRPSTRRTCRSCRSTTITFGLAVVPARRRSDPGRHGLLGDSGLHRADRHDRRVPAPRPAPGPPGGAGALSVRGRPAPGRRMPR